ncbi:tripartite tricarboxylate transporter substrate binding protein [Allopusillimonas soli]|uniref:Tripartite tricarboxylate transporter substrate binding protein n=1 Tax=Allopusillimonas soli TaxID=659016 RepID=A0A853FEQ6_9BURK|nr:tripartite tricarboxylate transporter substrate binding protein [Allopusillimonas soli]NYT38543.1 tripartite tricarboxylate transporter substrate binding protein [Allopusillimonas soli]TEA71741.1 tripartite tricarboxylate transporter substrate binding protein [Allopusillimonas soli]
MERRSLLKLLAAGAVCVPYNRLMAKGQDYPTHTIHMLVGSTPGSATDLASRLAAEILQNKYEQTVVVENKPGAGGVICMIDVAKAAPDGYTLQLGGLGHNVIPPVTRTGLPIDIPNQIMAIAQAAEFVNVLVVRKNHPANNLQEFIDYQKNRKKRVLYGSNGIGSSSHMTSELFGIRTGLNLEHVPYKAASDALIGTANGDLDLLFMNMPPTLPIIQTGQLKALAVTSSYRARQLPDVPTMQEQGMSDFDVTSWLGVYAPAGLAPEIVQNLSDTLVEGFGSQKYKQKFINAGFEPKVRNAKEFAEFNQAELKRWGDVAKKAGVSLPYGKA